MAKNFNKSSYALNKFSSGIAYKSVTGDYEISEEQFLAENPEMTHEDFLFWKNYSDNDYLTELHADTNEQKHTVPLGNIVETELISTPSVEDEYIRSEDEALCPRTIENAMRIFDEAKLTLIQRRRYLQHFSEGLSTRQIAEKEGISQKAIMDSIRLSEKKIKKVLKK
ncbi:MAG: hypothetical protein PHV32_00320 [Eubacteriales bacterium]|nr:hypothetical protein [Eubacteriales bacterium]